MRIVSSSPQAEAQYYEDKRKSALFQLEETQKSLDAVGGMYSAEVAALKRVSEELRLARESLSNLSCAGRLAEFVSRLSGDDRAIFVALLRKSGMKYVEIDEFLGISSGYASVLMRRYRRVGGK